jgi:hypothetical protein
MGSLIAADKTAKKQQVGIPFKPGHSGNPKGRPKGVRNKTTLAVEALLDGEAEAITRKAIEKAKDGDMGAIRLCLDRLVPPVKDRPVTLEMPQVESAQDAARAAGAVLQAVADGELTPSEAAEVSKIVRTYVAALEASELEQWITKLEEAK